MVGCNQTGFLYRGKYLYTCGFNYEAGVQLGWSVHTGGQPDGRAAYLSITGELVNKEGDSALFATYEEALAFCAAISDKPISDEERQAKLLEAGW
jgi:hypothetical protein